MLPFNKPPLTGNEQQYVLDAMKSSQLSGDGQYTKKCQTWLENNIGCLKALLTPSCTHALEMAAILINVKPGDEVIMPSYTFVSTANAFVLRGAQIVFVDVRPDTMNIDETKIERAITSKTKAIVPVHYAGVSCEMGLIMELARRYSLYVIEDAAQAMTATYDSQQLGSIADLATFSFHETKNYTSGGEGGALLINNKKFEKRAEIIREKGTNRSQFFRGMVDKYCWMDIGSSYLPSELQSAYLWGQLERVDKIGADRLRTWNAYNERFRRLAGCGSITVPSIPENCSHNGHAYYLKVGDLKVRTKLIEFLRENGIFAVFHYVPLHSSPAGLTHGRFAGTDVYTTRDSERLLRLPIFYGMKDEEIEHVAVCVEKFFE